MVAYARLPDVASRAGGRYFGVAEVVAKSNSVFSTIPIPGTITRNHAKYNAVLI